MPTNSTLPEGTDTIIAGAAATGTEPYDDFAAELDDAVEADLDIDATKTSNDAGSVAQRIRDEAGGRTAEWRDQATDKARDYATQGKHRATAALDNVSRLIADAAEQVDDKVGAEYGDYARRAQGAIDGLAGALRDKDVDQLFADARDLVRRSPGVAIGAAAVFGFAVVRLIKAGLPQPVADTPEPASEPEGKRRSQGGSKKAKPVA